MYTEQEGLIAQVLGVMRMLGLQPDAVQSPEDLERVFDTAKRTAVQDWKDAAAIGERRNAAWMKTHSIIAALADTALTGSQVELDWREMRIAELRPGMFARLRTWGGSPSPPSVIVTVEVITDGMDVAIRLNHVSSAGHRGHSLGGVGNYSGGAIVMACDGVSKLVNPPEEATDGDDGNRE